MSSYSIVRHALAASMQAYSSELNIYYYVPQSLVAPAAIVQPVSNRTIDYTQAMSSGFAKWNFHVLMVVGLVDEEAAQEQVGELVSPGSDLIQALNNTPLSNGYVQVTEAAVSEMTFTKGLYTYARLTVIACM